jgi:predicted nucleic acid-binding protein
LSEPVVLDTNVFVAAGFNPHSASAHILDLVEEGRLLLVWDQPTIREIRAILQQIPPLSWERRAELFPKQHRFTGEVDPQPFSWVPDPDDRKFAALAKAAHAVLVTNDAHLLAHRKQAGITIVTPDEFWNSFES